MTTDKVEVSIVVPVDPVTAFGVFVEKIDAWWKRTPRHLTHRGLETIVHLEPKVGGKLIERSPDSSVEMGSVTEWIPGERISLNWLAPWPISSGSTKVQIAFSPHPGGTLVTVVHWPHTPLEAGDAAASVIGLWWADLLASWVKRLPD